MSSAIERIAYVDGLAPAVGAYSLATIHDGCVWTAGQIAMDSEGKLVTALEVERPNDKGEIETVTVTGVEAEAYRVMHNLGRILTAASTGFPYVTKATIILTDRSDLGIVNGVFEQFFPKGKCPARTTSSGGLLLNASVEIDMIAIQPQENDLSLKWVSPVRLVV